MLPSTVFIDAKDVPAEELEQIESVARKRAMELLENGAKTQKTAPIKPANVKNITDYPKKKAEKSQSPATTKTTAKVISVAAPQFEGETQVVVANVQGSKGNYNVMAIGKHAERLIVLEGKNAYLEMTKTFNKKYQAYEAAEVHFSSKKAVVETEIVTRGGEFCVIGKDGKEARIAAHDLQTMKSIEDNVGKKVKLTLEHMEESQGEFIVTNVVPIGTDEAGKAVEKVS
jgi:hypothetical protein